MELKELDEFLLARALEHDSPTSLFRLACEYPDLGAGDPAGPGDGGRAGRAPAPKRRGNV
ncbi:hypothetical protein [Amycolatopsis alba]|uniref:hypothetical protein n=1 Tax=Amycolatopsis alba TaxID=76020 RepID=UPI00039AB7FB|nr:hypothetical protein [Amycolatopsis alba]